MASEDFLIRLSVVFKKFELIVNEFLSGICQFLNVGIIKQMKREMMQLRQQVGDTDASSQRMHDILRGEGLE